MLIQEAIQTGLPFQIPGMNDFIYTKKSQNVTFFHWVSDHTRCGSFPVEAILSANWMPMMIPDNILEFPGKQPIPPNRPDNAS